LGDLTNLLKVLGFTGPTGLVILLVLAYVFYPEKLDQLAGRILRFFSWGGDHIRRRTAQAEIQGDINDFGRAFNKEVAGAMPYGVDIRFVKEVDRAELQPDKQSVIVRIKERSFQDENLVRAMLAYCPLGVIPHARGFLDPCLSESLDFAVTRKLLARLKHASALHYLDTVAFPEACSATEGLESMCSELDRIDEQGFLSRIVLAELRDFGATVASRKPSQEHITEATEFVKYILRAADRRPRQNLNTWGHLGQYIKVGVVTVGIRERIQTEGLNPYLYHLLRLQEAGFKKVYLEAWGGEFSRSAFRRAGLFLKDLALRAQNQAASDEPLKAEQFRDEEPLAALDDDPGDSLSIRTAKEVAAVAHHEGIATVGRTMVYGVRDKFPDKVLRDYVLIELNIN